jgi:hypothetical protein
VEIALPIFITAHELRFRNDSGETGYSDLSLENYGPFVQPAFNSELKSTVDKLHIHEVESRQTVHSVVSKKFTLVS